MSLEVEDDLHAIPDSGKREQPSYTEFVIAEWIVSSIWRKRKFLALFTLAGGLVAVGSAFLPPPEFKSSAQLMPPDAHSFSAPSVLNALSGIGSLAPSMAESFMDSRSPGQTLIGILSSQSAQDDIINRFDLRRVYHSKFYADARKVLTHMTVIEENKKSGLITITVEDEDPRRARDIASAYIDELGKLVNSLSDSTAHRERVFLEERIKAVKAQLDSDSHKLSDFSSHHATFDVQRQGEATVEAAARLQGQLIAAQAELSGLTAIYTPENVRVREAQSSVHELETQLGKISGTGTKASDADAQSAGGLPSVRELPLLGFTYQDLYRQVSVEEATYETLMKEYELAQMQEAKEIPPVRVLDWPQVPERKSSPVRKQIVAIGLLLSLFMGILWILISTLWTTTSDTHPIKANILAMVHAIRGR